MYTEEKWRNLALLGALLGLSAVAMVAVHVDYRVRQEAKEKQQEQIQHRDKLLKAFLSDIETAKKETSNECSQVFVSYVRPPEGLDAIAPFIIMGEEIYLGSDEPSKRIWRMDYQLIPKGDKVELWKTQWLGVAMPPSDQDIRRQKLTEKYSPDSSRCRAK
jgi:hypothetical protein